MRVEMRPGGLGKAVLALALTLVACSSADAGDPAAKSQAASATTATTFATLPPQTSTSTSTSTTEAPTTTTSAPAQQSTTASIASVRALQERLAELGYDVGTPDGKWGARTSYSLMAFQKVEGLTRDGEDGPETQAALAAASKPGPMVPGGAATRIEIDVERQVMFHWVNGALARILPVSTGNNEYYCVDGECSTAVTPGGSFRIGRKAAGLEVAPLGELWWPMYFNGGIAIHGSPSVPAWPASHGCIRIPMYAAPTFYDQVGAGTRVHVLNSPEAEAPPDEGRAVPNAVAPPDTTSTTAPPATTTTTVVEPTTTTTTLEDLPPVTSSTSIPVLP
jgi:peptidoglycan hydrolase-like protein with peptidoglycan-binding domain